LASSWLNASVNVVKANGEAYRSSFFDGI